MNGLMSISVEREYTHKIQLFYDLGQLYFNKPLFLITLQRFQSFYCANVVPFTFVNLSGHMA
jgi:hypothetical protein